MVYNKIIQRCIGYFQVKKNWKKGIGQKSQLTHPTIPFLENMLDKYRQKQRGKMR